MKNADTNDRGQGDEGELEHVAVDFDFLAGLFVDRLVAKQPAPRAAAGRFLAVLGDGGRPRVVEVAEDEFRAGVGEADELLDPDTGVFEPRPHRRHPEDEHGEHDLQGDAQADGSPVDGPQVFREEGNEPEEAEDAGERLTTRADQRVEGVSGAA